MWQKRHLEWRIRVFLSNSDSVFLNVRIRFSWRSDMDPLPSFISKNFLKEFLSSINMTSTYMIPAHETIFSTLQCQIVKMPFSFIKKKWDIWTIWNYGSFKNRFTDRAQVILRFFKDLWNYWCIKMLRWYLYWYLTEIHWITYNSPPLPHFISLCYKQIISISRGSRKLHKGSHTCLVSCDHLNRRGCSLDHLHPS